MRVMKTYDYEDISCVLKDFGVVWVRNADGDLYLLTNSTAITLPTLRGDNLVTCEKYAKKNRNFAYKYDSSSYKITIWDKSVEQYEEISAPAFQQVNTCGIGMGSYAYNKYAESITGQVPTFQMRESAKMIFCDFMEFKRKHK